MLTWSLLDDEQAWDARLAALPAACFYQSSAWARARRIAGWAPLRGVGGGSLGASGCAAQFLLRRKLGITVAWCPGGPAGNAADWAASLPVFLRSELGRTAYARINVLREADPGEAAALQSAGWRRPSAPLGSGISLELDLAQPAQQRLAAASGNWRHNLKRSGKFGLSVARWAEPSAAQMAAIYRDMEDYKGLGEQHSEASLTIMLRELGDAVEVVRVCDAQGELLAFRAAAIYAGRGWDLLAAASRAARKVYASHAALWMLLDTCAARGVTAYDMGGADPVGNKGVYDFKRGTGARDIEYLGEWEWAGLPGLAPAMNVVMRRRGLAA